MNMMKSNILYMMWMHSVYRWMFLCCVFSCGYVIQVDVLSMQGSASLGKCWQRIGITCHGKTGSKAWSPIQEQYQARLIS